MTYGAQLIMDWAPVVFYLCSVLFAFEVGRWLGSRKR
jgi:hypothetical protein